MCSATMRATVAVGPRVLVLIVFIPLFFSVPAMVFAGIWFFTQVLQGTSELLSPFASSGIAWWAHIGGFGCGWGVLPWAPASTRPGGGYKWRPRGGPGNPTPHPSFFCFADLFWNP